MQYALYTLILIIPFQGYFNLYNHLSISIAQIMAILLFVILLFQQGVRKLIFNQDMGLSLAVFVFCVAMLFSVFVANNKVIAIQFFLKWISFISLYFSTISIIQHYQDIRKCILVSLGSAGLISVIAIYEYFQGFEKVLTWFANKPLAYRIMEPDTLREKIAHNGTNWTISSGRGFNLRAFGTFEDVISYSAYLGLILPFGLLSFVVKQGKKIFILMCVVLVLISLFLTFTRSAYLAFIIAMIATVFLVKDILFHRKYLFVLISFAAILMGIVVSNKQVHDTLVFRFDKPVVEQFDRRVLWDCALKIIKAKPVTGVGLSNYDSGIKKYCAVDAPVLPAHNQYLQIAAESGIIGLISYMFILLVAFRYSIYIYVHSRDPEFKLIGVSFVVLCSWYCVQSLFTNYLFGDKFSMMFWIMIGLIGSSYRVCRNMANVI